MRRKSFRIFFLLYSLVAVALGLAVGLSWTKLDLPAQVLAVILTIVLVSVASVWLARVLRDTCSALRRQIDGLRDHRVHFKPSSHFFPPFRHLALRLSKRGEYLLNELQSASAEYEKLNRALTSMIEGMMSIDREENILSANKAAQQILNIENPDIVGRPITEVVRNSEFHRIVREAFRSNKNVTKEITLFEDDQRYIEINAALLGEESKEPSGVLLVFHDVTRIRRLERVRRDFVANVSHELRTPITSIRGFVETLQGGALDSRVDAERFLEIIHRQSNRMEAIIEELLLLSSLESASEQEALARDESSITEIVRAASEVVEPKAEAKHVRIEIQPHDEFYARVRGPLLEQAVVNLLDNAIKYSPEKSSVKVGFSFETDEFLISIKDSGPGIEGVHQPRLFERFYRIDKARSRKAGGTGLGLAIVKHISQVHGGRASVKSSPGQGSTFSIHLPNHLLNNGSSDQSRYN